MHDVVFKILTTLQWQQLQATGRLGGSPDDLRDGFIHLSTAPQLPGTLAKHFAGQTGLICVAIETVELGAGLRWEPSREGQLFPHFHGTLHLTAVSGHQPCDPVPPAPSANPEPPA